jgi:hypothetical protein
VPEYPKFTVTLHGQELTGTYGHTMRLVKAKTEAGPMPTQVDPESPTDAEGEALVIWQAEFVRVYFGLLQDFMLDCTAEEIIATANAIGEAAMRDPFGQLSVRPTPEPTKAETPPSEAPITGS